MALYLGIKILNHKDYFNTIPYKIITNSDIGHFKLVRFTYY